MGLLVELGSGFTVQVKHMAAMNQHVTLLNVDFYSGFDHIIAQSKLIHPRTSNHILWHCCSRLSFALNVGTIAPFYCHHCKAAGLHHVSS